MLKLKGMDMWRGGVYGSLRIREWRRKEADHGRVVKKKEGQWWWGKLREEWSRERIKRSKQGPTWKLSPA
jgi:hypothetical protein